MSTYQLVAAAVGVTALWVSKDVLRSILLSIFPKGLPGETNTILLASPRPNSSSPPTTKDLEGVTEYDYIIIGTGTAGSVLASRLTEDAGTSVLAIEAGHSDLKQVYSRMPAGVPRLWRTAVDWAFETTPQPQCQGRKLEWPRGKMIGGSSSINAMLYTRGAPDDYDEWERLGNKGWGYQDVVKYFRKAEHFSQPRDTARKLSLQDLAQHGQSGPWDVGYTWRSEISTVFADACHDIGILKTADFNTDRGILGASPMQTFIDTKGQRSSAAKAYLTTDVNERSNLKIASGQTVTRIIFDTSGSQPRAIGVEMAASKRAAVRYLAKARKEVLLCCGAVGSPHLLKISGIGPADELASKNISVIKHVPGLGENLMDHMAYHGLVFRAPVHASMHYLQHPVKGLPTVIEWFRHGTGPMASQACDAAAFIRCADRDDALASIRASDDTSGPNSADLELLCFSICFADNGKFIAPYQDGYCTITPTGLRPKSRGTVKIATDSVFDPPLIDPKVYSNEYDLDMLLYGVRLGIQIAKAQSYKEYFKGWYVGPQHPIDWDNATDEEIKESIRQNSGTLYHPMGTAKMGNDKDAVVDDQLRVHGISGLRVIDASIFPTPLACHPCAPVIMVAEKAAEMIRGSIS